MNDLIPIIDKVVNFGIGAVIVIGVFVVIVFTTILAIILYNFREQKKWHRR